MKSSELAKGKNVIRGIVKDHFSPAEIKAFEKGGVTMDIRKLPPDIAGQSMANEIYLDPETVRRADAVTEDVVVHELVHAYNRFREQARPEVYARKESQLESPADVQNDIEIEEAVTEAITLSKLAKFDEKSKKPVAMKRGDLHKRYNYSAIGLHAGLPQKGEPMDDATKKLIEKEAKKISAKMADSPVRVYSPEELESAMDQMSMMESIRSKAEKAKKELKQKKDFQKLLTESAKAKREEVGRLRLTEDEKSALFDSAVMEIYGRPLSRLEALKNTDFEYSPGSLPDPSLIQKEGRIGNSNTRLVYYPEDTLDPNLHLDPISGAQSNRRFKVAGETKNFPVMAIGYDKSNLDTYGNLLRDMGFYVRTMQVNYDSTNAVRRWAIFAHPKPNENSPSFIKEISEQYELDPTNPQFGAKLRLATRDWMRNNSDIDEIERLDEIYENSIVLNRVSPRWKNVFDEGPAATDVRIFNREIGFANCGNCPMNECATCPNKYIPILPTGVPILEPKRRTYNRDWAGKSQGFTFEGTSIVNPFYDETMRFEVDPAQHYGQAYADWLLEMSNNGMTQREIREYLESLQPVQPYTLNAVPVDIGALQEAMSPEDTTGLGLDERAGQVYDLEDAFVVQHVWDNRGRLESYVVGVYSSEDEARRAIQQSERENPIAEGYYDINELDGLDVWDFYRQWPYYFKRGTNEQWIKRGIEGTQVVFERIGFRNADEPRFMRKDWLEESLEAEEALSGPDVLPLNSQAYFRRINGKTFRGLNRNLPKNQARFVAQRLRQNGYNARVIPTSKGHRVYLRRR